MHNKKVLQTAIKELDKRKAPPAPKDIITDPAGQWKYPGLPTRIPSNKITMQGVNYPVLGVPDKGEPTMMHPGGYYNFPEANYVDEYPQMKKGGSTIPIVEDAGSMNEDGFWIPDWEVIAMQAKQLNAKTVKTKSGAIIYFDNNWQVKSVDEYPQMKKGGVLKSKKYTKNIMGKSYLFEEGPLFKKKKESKKRIFHPNAKYYQDGGIMDQEEPTGGITSQEEIDAANRAMMKARLAYADMHGNPAAERMVVAPDQPYEYTGDEYDQLWGQPVGAQPGMIGTHYMASFDNYAVPFIQQGPNGLYFNEAPSVRDREAIRFDSEEDAEYFGGHYKEVAPDKSYRRKIENGSPYITSLSPEDEEQFQRFYSTLPENLQSDDPSYDIRGYWDSEGRPEEFDYSQPKEDDGYYHAYSINQNTGKYLKNPWHPTFQHAIDEDRKIGYRPVVNVKGEIIATENPSIADPEEQTFLRNTEGPANYIETELTPEEIQEYAKGGYIVEELDSYAEGGDPGDVQCPPGYVYNPETKYCEKKSGCPEGFTFDPKSGRCVSNYEKESVKVYTGPYKYGPDGRKITDPTRYDISELREAKPEELITATQREQQLWPEDNFNWPSDYTVKEILNPIYFLPSQTNWIDVNGTQHPFDVYPDLNYKVVVDPKKPEGFNKDENIYYVKSENTHQFKKYKEWELLKQQEKDTIAEAEKRGYTIKQGNPEKRTILPYNTYKQTVETNEIDPDTGQEYTYSREEFLPGWDEKSFANQEKLVSDLYKDPEYLGYDAYNKSFDELYKDRPQLNKQQWSQQCKDCTYNHGYSFQIAPDYIYRSYNPNQNKVGPTGSINRVIATLENEYADPNIVQQIPTMEEYEYPDAPGYNPVDYKGVGIHPVWSHGHKQKKHFMADPNRGKRGSLDDMFYMYTTFEDTRHLKGFGKHPRTKVIPSIVQKSTGYNPQAMEGYYNEEGDWVPGEYEKAEEEGRKINFQGAASLRDLKRQKEYLSKYDDYMKERENIDEMNKQLREEWLPPAQYAEEYAKGGSSCPPGYIKINGKCKKYKEVAPFITSDPEEYAYRKAAYEDSLYLANKFNSQQPKTKKYTTYTGPLGVNIKGKPVKVKKGYVPTNRKLSYVMDDNYSKLSPAWKKFISDSNRKGDRTGRYNFDNRPIGYQWEEAFFDTHALNTPFGVKTFTLLGEELLSDADTRPRFQPPKQQVIFQQPPKPKPKVHQYPTEYKPVVNNIPQTVPEGKKIVGQEEVLQLDPKTGTVTTVINPIYETVIPPTVNPELQKFVEEKKPEPPGPPPGTGTDVMPVYDETDIETGTPGPGGHWEDKYSRYIDWDGNSVGFNGIRFRKPGHGGDLIKKGRRHYIHYPSIEKRLDAWIEPDKLPEEEYQNGGEYNIGDEVELTEAEVKRLRSLGYIIEEV